MKQLLTIGFLLISIVGLSQSSAVNFLLINPDARIEGFGDIGVVGPQFYNGTSLTENPALLCKGGKWLGADFSYMRIGNDVNYKINFKQANAFYSINEKNAIGYSIRRLRLGEISFADVLGNITGIYTPKEVAQQITFAHLFSKYWSGGISAKYIHSDLTGGNHFDGVKSKPGRSVAFDLGAEYNNSIDLSEKKKLNYHIGGSLLHIGSKVSYVDSPNASKDFLPATLQFGALFGPQIELTKNYHFNLDIAYQVEKRLVPTEPIYKIGADGDYVYDNNGNALLESGMDPNVSVFRGMYQSFYDAPGGTIEELHELSHRFGVEARWTLRERLYWAFRYGSVKQHESKSNENHNIIGFGLGFFGFSLNYFHVLGKEDGYNLSSGITLGFRMNLENEDFFKF